LKGGKSVHNPGNWRSHFPWAGNNKNYIRGDTELRGDMDLVGKINMTKLNPGAMIERNYKDDHKGDRYGIGQFETGAMRMYTSSTYGPASINLSVAQQNGTFDDVVKVNNKGDTEIKGELKANKSVKIGDNMSVGGKFFIGAKGFNTDWDWYQNGSDAYWLEKVHPNGNVNSSTLRLTMNDDADEAFEIYGGSCKHGAQCKGPGQRKHYFGVDGTALHTGQVCVSSQCLTESDIRKLKAKI
jgi:hypothetical protein